MLPAAVDINRKALAMFLSQTAHEAHFPQEGAGGAGRLMVVAGARGGVGASTIAANLAWAIAQETSRHTLLLDTDLYAGTSALNLNTRIGWGLVEALASAEPLNNPMLESITRRVGERLFLLAAQGDLASPIDYAPERAAAMTKMLRQNYNYVIADAGARLLPFARDLLSASEQRVIVLDPSLVAMRNFERFAALPSGARPSTQPVLVLNKAGRPGGLSQNYMEQTLGIQFSVVMPDSPRIVPKSDQLGEMAASLRGPFRNGILKLAEFLGANVLHQKYAKVAAMA